MANRKLCIITLAICILTTDSNAMPEDETIEECKEKCPQSNKDFRSCASDGNIYINLCEAQCTKPKIIEIFKCSVESWFGCSLRCRLASEGHCEVACPSVDAEDKICASDGNLYPNFCRAKCINSNNTILFKCSSSDPDCEEKCIQEARNSEETCEAQCPVYVREQLQCGSDGNLYIDECRANCVDPEIKILFDCGYPVKEEECRERCKDTKEEKTTNKNQNPITNIFRHLLNQNLL